MKKCPEYLYKIISTQEWDSFIRKRSKILPNSKYDMDYVRLSTYEQIGIIINKYWKFHNCIILKIASSKLMGIILYENENYNLYHGKIPHNSITNVNAYIGQKTIEETLCCSL